MEESVKRQPKVPMLISIAIMFVISVAPLSAQNSLPNPQDSYCWESLSALRACAIEQQNRELDYAERCTSYPEYQCAPAPDQSASQVEMAKKNSKTNASKKDADVRPLSSSDLEAATATAQPLDAK